MIPQIYTPKKISKPQPYLLRVEWQDGFSADILIRDVRDECPCASCKGENIMGTTYSFGIKVNKPGMYELQGIHPVGNYAVQAIWNDGHNTGIYTWEILRHMAETKKLSDEQLQEYAEQARKEGITS
jgi:DUF971 family protein